MSKAGRTIKRVSLVLYLLVIHAVAALFVFERFIRPYIWTDNSYLGHIKPPFEETPAPTIIPVPSITEEQPVPTPAENGPATDSNQNSNANQSPAPTAPTQPLPVSGTLMIPVVGIKREQITDSFSDSRSEGRNHDAIDIMAPAGTPVVAAANGEIVKFYDSELGGITIYQLSADRQYVYYYAHLQRRADNLKEKDFVTQGTIIGYVGDTGNSGAGNYHLHFSIHRVTDPNRYWNGEYINPYPLLKNGLEAR